MSEFMLYVKLFLILLGVIFSLVTFKEKINEKINRLAGWSGKLIALSVYTFGLYIIYELMQGYMIGEKATPEQWQTCRSYTFIIWTGIYVAWGLRQVPQNEWLLVARAGPYYKTFGSGWCLLCLPGFIDKTKKGHYLIRAYVLYGDESVANLKPMIDFADKVSAPIRASAFLRVSQSIEHAAALYTYMYEEVEKRIAELFDGKLRPRLQSMELEDACKSTDTAADDVMRDPELKQCLAEIGTEVRDYEPLIIDDIAIPVEVKQLRDDQYEGARQAEKMEKIGEGYAKAIEAIRRKAKESGEEISFEKAEEIFNRQRTLETIRDTKATLVVVGKGAGDMVDGFTQGLRNLKDKKGEKK